MNAWLKTRWHLRKEFLPVLYMTEHIGSLYERAIKEPIRIMEPGELVDVNPLARTTYRYVGEVNGLHRYEL